MPLTNIRDLYPHLNQDGVYFNHAAMGPMNILTQKAIDVYVKGRTIQPIDQYPQYLEWSNMLKDNLSKMFNCTPDRLAWTDCVGTSMNMIAQGLDFQEGDHIILNDLEFPSNVYPFLNLEKQGVKVEIVSTENGVVSIEKIEAAITPKTKLISVSHVQFLTGYRVDLVRLGEICKKHGIIFCVDVIQSTGVVNIDIKKMNIDFLAGGSHKWLMALIGLGYFYISEELQSKINQKYVGWTAVNDMWNLLDYKIDFRDTADRFQNGGHSFIGVVALSASLEIIMQIGIDKVEEAILSNTDYLINSLSELGYDSILKGLPNENRAGIVSIKLEESDKLAAELKEKNVTVAVRQGILRMSPHYYNTKDDIDEFISRLKSLL